MPKFNFKKNGAGFTLIELLLVISIISLVASIVLVSLNSARIKARNAKRVDDIKQLVTAFNIALNSSATGLPDTGGVYACVSLSCYGGFSAYIDNAAVKNFISPYLAAYPSDPTDPTRGYGGFLYRNPLGPLVGYDGSTFPQGVYLNYMVEPPLNSTSCGMGRPVDVKANYVQCLLKLD